MTAFQPIAAGCREVAQTDALLRALRNLRHWLISLREEQSSACAILKRYGVQRERVLTRMPDSSQEQGPPRIPYD